MSVTTSSQINMDTLIAALPANVTSVEVAGSPIDSAGSKKLTVDGGVSDAALQTAVTTAAGQFVDRGANRATLLAKLPAALTANATYLGLGAASTTAQDKAQIQRLTREWNALARVVAGLVDDISNT